MKNKTLLVTALSAIFFLSFQSLSQASVYKWEDEKGQVHYSDQPDEPDAEKFSIRSNTTTKPRTNNRTEKTTGKNADESAKEPAEPKLVEVEFSAKAKRKMCNEAKSDIEAISNRGRMREINEKGEYVYLTEQQRQQRLSAARKKQRDYCR